MSPRTTKFVVLDYCTFLFGALLVVAGVLKIHSSVIEYLTHINFADNAIVNVFYAILGCAEIWLGMMICIAEHKRFLLVSGSVAYAIFFAVQIVHVLSDSESCNCLCVITMSPANMSILNCAGMVVFAFAAKRTTENGVLLKSKALLTCSFIAFLSPLFLYGVERVLDTSNSLREPLVIDSSQPSILDKHGVVLVTVVNRGYDDIVLMGANFT